MRHEKKRKLHQLRHWRIRRKVSGTAARPRMAVCFTNAHIYVQFIDDVAGATLASASTRAKTTPGRENLGANVESAKAIGKLAAEMAKAKGITQVVFDRGGERYHWSEGQDGKPVYGKVAALAEAAREAGLKF
jgi:large subunit ribosomal protein L18